jgi:hypothetical protein
MKCGNSVRAELRIMPAHKTPVHDSIHIDIRVLVGEHTQLILLDRMSGIVRPIRSEIGIIAQEIRETRSGN